MTRLAGKVVLLSGTARGIGRAAALRFAAEGATVAGGDLLIDEARETLTLVEAAGGAGSCAALDATDEHSVHDWVNGAVQPNIEAAVGRRVSPAIGTSLALRGPSLAANAHRSASAWCSELARSRSIAVAGATLAFVMARNSRRASRLRREPVGVVNGASEWRDARRTSRRCRCHMFDAIRIGGWPQRVSRRHHAFRKQPRLRLSDLAGDVRSYGTRLPAARVGA